jgi:hypothetical protein
MLRRPTLEAWFLHYDLALNVLGQDRAAPLIQTLPAKEAPLSEPRWRNAFSEALALLMEDGAASSLATTWVTRRAARGDLVWLDQAFYFKGVAKARSEGTGRPTFSGRLDVDPNVTVTGDIGVKWVGTETAVDRLSGRGRHFILGYVEELTLIEIKLRPILIGQRIIITNTPGLRPQLRDEAHVWPKSIDQFRDVTFNVRSTRSDLEQLRTIPEDQVKKWFADILGEPQVPKDWGGEQFDLWTRRLSIDGEQVRAAIAFKGPAAFHPMRIADLGKNGDQIDRLAQTAADLLVVQHCHEITAPVDNMLRNYALSPERPRRYMTINGYETLAILKHHRYIQ